MNTHTTLHVEAALCLWEAMIDNRDKNPALDDFMSNEGAVQSRHTAISLAPAVCEVWAGIGEDAQDSLCPYDWEFVPLLLGQIEWSRTPTLDVPKAIEALRKVAGVDASFCDCRTNPDSTGCAAFGCRVQ